MNRKLVKNIIAATILGLFLVLSSQPSFAKDGSSGAGGGKSKTSDPSVPVPSEPNQ